jgi:hypothetical protein
MQKTRILLALVVAACLAGPSWLKAQNITSPYAFLDKKKDIGIFVGYIFADQGAAGLGSKDGPLAGVQFNLQVSEPINLGFSAAYFPSNRDVIDPSAESEADRILGEADFNMLMLLGRLQLHLTGSRKWHNLVPIVYGGAGLALDVTSSPSCFSDFSQPDCQLSSRERFDFGSSFIGQIGLALAWIPGQRLGLRFSADDSIWRLSTPDGFYDETSTLDPVPSSKDWTNNIQLTLGLYFRF